MNFPWIRVAPLALALVTISLLALIPAPARAAYEIAGGYVEELDDEGTYTAHATWLSSHRYPWEVTAGYIAARDDATPRISPHTLYVSLARRFVHRTGFYFAGGIALTNTDGDDEALSGTFQFVNGVGWQGERIVITFRHISNASTGGRNRGENLLTIGWRF